MPKIRYSPNHFIILEVQASESEQEASIPYQSLVGKSVLKVIDPTYVANFLHDHFNSFREASIDHKRYKIVTPDGQLFCDVQFDNFQKSNEIHELMCNPAYLLNTIQNQRDRLAKSQHGLKRIQIVLDSQGKLIQCSGSGEGNQEAVNWNRLQGVDFFAQVDFTNLVLGEQVTANKIDSYVGKEDVWVLWNVSSDKKEVFALTTTRFTYKDDVLYTLQLNTLLLPDAEIDASFILELFNNKIQQAVIVTDLIGNVQFWNNHAERLYGWKKEEVIGKNVMHFIPVQQSIEQAEEIMAQLQAGQSWSGVFLAQNKMGDPITIQVYDSPLMNADGRLAGIIGVSWDISEQEKDKSIMLLQQKLLDDTEKGIIACNEQGRIIYMNKYLKSLFKKAIANSPNLTIQSLCKAVIPNDKALYVAIEEVFHGKRFMNETTLIQHGHPAIQLTVSGFPVYGTDDQLNGATIFFTDVSDKHLYRRLHEMEIRNREALINNTDDWMWIIDKQYCLQTANDALLNRLELYFNRRIDIGTYLLDEKIYPASYLQQWKNWYDRALSGETVFEVVSSPQPNGDIGIVYVALSLKPLYDLNQEIQGVVCYGRNITEQKNMLSNLQVSEKRFSTIFAAAPLGIAIIDSYTGKIAELNERFAEIAGRTREAMMQIDWMQITHPDDVEKDLQLMQELNAKRIPSFSMEKRYIRPNGEVVWINMSIKPLDIDEYANPHHLCMIQDITSSIQDRASIQLSNERYELAIKATNDMIWDWDVLNDKVYRGEERFVELTGYSKEFKDKDGKFWFGITHPDDLTKLKLAVEDMMKSGSDSVFDVNYRLIRADGKSIYVNDKGFAQKNEAGELIRVIGAVKDITEQMHYQEELERLSLIATKTINVVIITDPEGKAVWVNEAFTRNTGYRVDEIIGKIPGAMLQGPETDQRTIAFMAEKIRKRESFECEVLNYHKNGSAYWIFLQVQPVFDEQNQLKYFFAIQTDITQNKRAQEELKRSELKYRNLFDNSPVNIVIWNPVSMRIEEVNARAVLDYRMSKDALEGLEYQQLHQPHVASQLESIAQRILSNEEQAQRPSVYASVDAKKRPIYMQISFHRLEVDGRVSIMAIGNNITEQVKLERSLEEERKIKQDEVTMAVLNAQEKERTYLGQELHDNVNQLLSVAKMYLSLVKKRDEQFEDHLAHADKAISEAIKDIRQISHELIVPKIGEGEIGFLLEELFNRFSSATKIPVEIRFKDEDVEGIAEAQLLAIYRIMQEQMNNILKYAKASTVFVDFDRKPDQLLITVKDDGVGFDLSEKKKTEGVGLKNMRTRASLFNGEVRIESAVGQGCTLYLHFQL